MTAKEAVQMIREKIETEIRDDSATADAFHKAVLYEQEDLYRTHIAALNRALCCVGDVEKQLH